MEFKCSSLSGSVRVGIKVYIGVGMLMLQCLSQKCWSFLLELIVGVEKVFELQCWSWLLELHVGVVVLDLEC